MPPAKGSKRSPVPMILLAVLAVVLLGAGGVMTYLWMSTSSELDETRTDLTAQVEQLEGTVTDRDSQIDNLQGQLDDARDQVQSLETDLEGSEGEVEFLREASEAIESCLTAIEDWLVLVTTGDESEANDFFDDELIPTCDEAEQYR